MSQTLLRFSLQVAVAASCFMAAVPLAFHKSARIPKDAEAGKAKYDEDYAAALKAANLFCQHWMHGDYPVAKLMLTERIRYEYPEQRLRDIIGGVGNPRQLSYEIYDGRKLDDNRIAFRIRLFQVYIGQGDKRLESPLEQIVLIKKSNNNWLVDEFPIP